MTARPVRSRLSSQLPLLAAITMALLLPGPSAAENPAMEKPFTAAQKRFATPKEAADALVAAARTFDTNAFEVILGKDGKELVITEDAVADKQRAAAFVAKADEKSSIVVDPKKPKVATFVVGADDFPLPIPIVKDGKSWRFDSKKGRQEVLARRIGQNELDAIRFCRGYVEAQKEYASEKRDGSPVNQYAQRILSTEGRQDGLAWRNADGTFGGPVGEGAARAIAEGHSDRFDPFHGYYFRALKSQGPSARMGAMNYVVKGFMIGGFALVAAPAEYGVTGVKTFMVSHDGIVYEKDLGPGSVEKFWDMKSFDPDKSWKPVKEN